MLNVNCRAHVWCTFERTWIYTFLVKRTNYENEIGCRFFFFLWKKFLRDIFNPLRTHCVCLSLPEFTRVGRTYHMWKDDPYETHRRCIFTFIASILLFEYLAQTQITVGGDAISQEFIYEFSHLNSAHIQIFIMISFRWKFVSMELSQWFLRQKKKKKNKNEIVFRIHCFLTIKLDKKDSEILKIVFLGVARWVM